jgi:hypothetical protein
VRVGFGPFAHRTWGATPNWFLRQVAQGLSSAARRASAELHRRAELTKRMTDEQRDEFVRRWENEHGYRRM